MNDFPLSPKQKVPFVCFGCRAAIKLPLGFCREEFGERVWSSQVAPECPTCKKTMTYLGRYFKVPPRSSLNQWRKDELLWRRGWIADGYSDAPRTLRDAREFIQRPNTIVTNCTLKRRAETEKRWRQLRAKRPQKGV